MGSRIPGVGTVKGFWTRVFFDEYNYTNKFPNGTKHYTKTRIADKAMTEDRARAFIEKHGLVCAVRQPDGEVWVPSDGSFRTYAKRHRLKVPDDLGINTITDRCAENSAGN